MEEYEVKRNIMIAYLYRKLTEQEASHFFELMNDYIYSLLQLGKKEGEHEATNRVPEMFH